MSRLGRIWETAFFAVFAVTGFFLTVYGLVGDDRVDVASGMAMLAFAKASRAMAWHHGGRP